MQWHAHRALRRAAFRGGAGDRAPLAAGLLYYSVTDVSALRVGTGCPRSSSSVQLLDLADQVQRRLQGFGAFAPLGRADFTRVRGDVLGSLDLAHQFRCVA